MFKIRSRKNQINELPVNQPDLTSGYFYILFTRQGMTLSGLVAFFLIILLLFLAGCGTSTEQVNIDHNFNLLNYPERLIAIEMEKQTIIMQEILDVLKKETYGTH